MPRWSLIVLLVAAVVCAGIGVGLAVPLTPLGDAGSGWTAYSPLSKTVYSGSYEPIDVTWSFWGRRIGVVLLALGAGTSGAVLVALLTKGRRSTARRSDSSPTT
jgi:heme/copper-type cytochrome/quinol oxidase subunit 1